MDILIIILLISLGAGFLIYSFLCESERKGRKHRILGKLRAETHRMGLALDIAKNANDIEKKDLESLKSFLHDIADEVEEL